MGFGNFDCAVFEFDEDERESVYKDYDVWSSVVILSLYPHLGDGGECVVFWVFEVDEFYEFEVFDAVSVVGDFYGVSEFLVVLVVDVSKVSSGGFKAELFDGGVED